MTTVWTVQTTHDGLFEYDGYATVSGGALCLYLDSGDNQFWGPGFWSWAKCEKVRPPESVPIQGVGTGD